MTEFCMENWNLQKIVRESGDVVSISAVDNLSSAFDPLSIQQETLLKFSGTFETNTRVLDELEDLCRPSYPQLNPLSTQSVITGSLSVPQDVEEPETLESQQSPCQPTVAANSRKRKNQQNRVVQRVKADGPSSDRWAWRKYGQKPIKGSPYRRLMVLSVSLMVSLSVWLNQKQELLQMQQLKRMFGKKASRTLLLDPELFIITYTAEHSHEPTRWSSLAGTIRTKPSKPKYPAFGEPRLPKNSVFSLTTALVTPTEEDQFLKQDRMKREKAKVLEDLEGDKIFSPDITLND